MFFQASEWFAAFLLTLVVEVPVVLVLVWGVVPDRPRLVALVVFANLASHPAVWFVFTQLFLVGTLEYLAAAEAWAVGVEALFYMVTVQRLGPRRALGVALSANAASFAVGWLLQDILRQPFG
jgi:hypothetical protein